MNTPSHNEPAFPMSGDPAVDFDRGLTKREVAAFMVIQAMLPKLEPSDSLPKLYTTAVGIADGLLDELSK